VWNSERKLLLLPISSERLYLLNARFTASTSCQVAISSRLSSLVFECDEYYLPLLYLH
jgi:hypothetical protein